MKLNYKLTPKLLSYFHTWELKGNRIKYVNLLDSTVYYGPVKSLKPDTYVLLDKQGLFLSKNHCKTISKSIALETWIIHRLTQQQYNKFHEMSQATSFYDYIASDNPILLMSQIEPETLKLKVCDLLATYKELIKPKSKTLRFSFLSKQKDSVLFLNQLCEKYVLKKQGFKYTIVLDQPYKQVLSELTELLENYKTQTQTIYKIH